MLQEKAKKGRKKQKKKQKPSQALLDQSGHVCTTSFSYCSCSQVVFLGTRMAPEGEDVNADLSLARLCSKLLEEDVLGHPQPVLAVGVVQRGVIPLRDLAHPHIGHRRLEQQQLAANRFHH